MVVFAEGSIDVNRTMAWIAAECVDLVVSEGSSYVVRSLC